MMGKARRKRLKGAIPPKKDTPFKRWVGGIGSGMELCFLLILILITFLIYSNIFKGPFIFDSQLHIQDDPHMRLDSLTLEGIKKAVFSRGQRPVSRVSFALNYYLCQYNVSCYRLVNILIHISVGLLLYFLVKATIQLPSLQGRYGQQRWIPFLATLIWLIHPVQTQSVTYVIQRMNSLAVMFFLLSLFLYARARLAAGKRNKGILFSGCIFAGLLALGSKQIAATLPFFIFLYEWYFFQDLKWSWVKRHGVLFATLLICLAVLAFLFFHTGYWQKVMALYALKDFTMLERLLTEARVVLFYLGLLIVPHPSRLNLDHDFTISHSLLNPPTTLIALGIIAAILFLAVYLAKKDRLLSFCILWFLGNLVIESSFIPLALIYEHRLYLPSMGICLISVLLGYRYLKSTRVKIVLICLVTVVFSVWTHQRNEVWTDALVFWKDCVSKSPEKGRPHLNLGVTLRERGHFDESIKEFQKAILFDPRDEKAPYNLGVALEKQGKVEEAIGYYLKALELKPDFVDAHNNLGIALASQGNYKEAISHHMEALVINPNYVKAHISLGAALEKQGNLDDAIQHYRKALRLQPDYAKAYYNLAGALARQGNFDQAIHNYYEVLRIDPQYSKAHYNLGVVLLRQGKNREAAFHFGETLRIDPDNRSARRALQLLSR